MGPIGVVLSALCGLLVRSIYSSLAGELSISARVALLACGVGLACIARARVCVGSID